jgi:hypothetical protein
MFVKLVTIHLKWCQVKPDELSSDKTENIIKVEPTARIGDVNDCGSCSNS